MFALILSEGDEVIENLTRFSREKKLGVSQFTGIGAFSKSQFGYFDPGIKDYIKIPLDEQAEVLTLLGDITINEEKYKVHAHTVTGLRDGSTRGGHLLKGFVSPTLEIILTESPVYLHRSYNEKYGLALIDLQS